ncbi:MAG TPA: hypothetical protein VIF09_11490 [Polyangiaceae bacterium]|jgi:hypothetical protein
MPRRALAIGVAPILAACGLLAPLDGLTGGDAGADARGSEDAGDAFQALADALPSETGAADAPSQTCEAGLTVCGGACVDLQSEASSCGRCGHDCGGGACDAGTCQPVTLASGLDSPRALTVSGSTVYFTTHGSSGYVASCPTTGCGSNPTVLTKGLALGAGIAVSGTSIFFAAFGNSQGDGGYAGNGAFSCSTMGCAQATPLASSPGNPVGITTDGAFVYWNDSSLGQILSCAAGGCGGVPTVITSGQSSPWYGVAVDASSAYVYWTGRGDGTVDRCDLPACAKGALPIATGRAGPFDLAVDATSVYFTSYDPNSPMNPASGTVESCAVTGCSGGHVIFAGQQVTPVGIAVDDSAVYWANNGDGTIASCPKSGCPSAGPMQLAASQSGPFLVALDTGFVYWTNTSGGTVMRVAKP